MNGGFLVLLLAMFGFMYFLLIRPQRQQQRKHTELLSSLKPGEEGGSVDADSAEPLTAEEPMTAEERDAARS